MPVGIGGGGGGLKVKCEGGYRVTYWLEGGAPLPEPKGRSALDVEGSTVKDCENGGEGWYEYVEEGTTLALAESDCLFCNSGKTSSRF
jgi:hypothetical protein